MKNPPYAKGRALSGAIQILSLTEAQCKGRWAIVLNRKHTMELKAEGTRYQIYTPTDDTTILRIIPILAKQIGLDESIVLMQIEHWIGISNNLRDGKYWTYQSLQEMHDKAFGWWDKSTISRIIKRLEKGEYIFVANYNHHAYDRTQWFALNPVGLRRLKNVIIVEAKEYMQNPNQGVMLQNAKSMLSDAKSMLSDATTIPERTTERTTKKKKELSAPVGTGDDSQTEPANFSPSEQDLDSPKPTRSAAPRPPKSDTHPLRRQYADDGTSPNPFKAILTAFWMGKPTDQVTHSDVAAVAIRFTGKEGLFAKGSPFEQLYDERGGFTPEQLQAAVDKWIKQNKDWDIAKRPGHTKLYAHIVPLMPSTSKKKKSRWEPVYDENGDLLEHQEVEE